MRGQRSRRTAVLWIFLTALLGGCGAESAFRTSADLPPATAPDVTLSVAEGRLTVQSPHGLASVEFGDDRADIRVANGQRLRARFHRPSHTFFVEIVRDADRPIDVGIGKAVIHATRGDVFTARSDGAHLDVFVRRGILRVIGPDGRSEEVSQDGRLTVVGGAVGAVAGTLPPPARPPGIPRIPLRDRRPDPVRDRTDIEPLP